MGSLRSSNVFGGLIVIAIGVIFLGQNAGWWTHDIWGQIIDKWPVILIIVGLRQIVKNDPLFLVLSLATVALAFGFAYRGYLGVMTPMNNGPMPKVSSFDLKKEFSKSFDWSTSPEDREMIEFKSEIQVNGLDTLAVQLSRHYTISLNAVDTDKVIVDLKGPKSIIDDLSLTPDGNKLYLKDSREGLRIFSDLEGVTGTVTLPKSLALELNLSGFADLKVNNHTAGLKLEGSGTTTVTFVDSTSHNPTIDLSGAGRVDLDKCDGEAVLKLSGVGSASANSCSLSKLKIEASGTSGVDLKTGSIGDLKVDVSGVAKVKLPKPTGKVEQDSSGASSINFY